jgi:hypothetical protein
VFTGCSFTAGNGWIDAAPETSVTIPVKDCPFLWVNLCKNNIQKFDALELINHGQGGASNTEIFQNTIEMMSTFGADIDTLFCQWTSMPRYNFTVGFELWNTAESLTGPEEFKNSHNINLNRGDRWTREYIDDILNRLKTLHHLHWEILKVVQYTNIISNLANKLKIKNLFFINGLCPWDKNYFVKLHDVLPEAYTGFTKKEILNIETRDDEDIYKLYELAHQHYQEAGGINLSQWVNLYDSFLENRIDFNFDNQHPGKKSNELYYLMVNQKLNNLT